MVAIVVLVLWLFTAGAGFSVLISSNLKRDGLAPSAQLAPAIAGTAAPPAPPAPRAPAAPPAPVPRAAAAASGPQPVSRREAKRARRERFDPPSLVAARKAPVLPGPRALLEFAHPACGITGLAFWLGFALVHTRVLGWIGFGLAAATACAGLTWFAVNVRAGRRPAPDAPPPDAPPPDAPPPDAPPPDAPPPDAPPPSFRGRLVALHGSAAVLTLVLATLTVLVLHG